MLLPCANTLQYDAMFSLTMELGPYEKNQSDVSVEYMIKSSVQPKSPIYEIFRFGNESNPNLRTVTKASHRMPSTKKYTSSVTIPTKTFLGDNGMKITYELHFDDGTFIESKEFYLYPKKSETIDPTKYGSDTYSCSSCKVWVTSDEVTNLDERYGFRSVDDYFLTDVYYRLPLEQFVIQTSLSSSDFSYEKAYLKVTGLSDYFPGLVFTNNECTIPLTVNYKRGFLSFQIDENLYVEKRTLTISNIPRTGYVLTRHFYLPINRCHDLVGSAFTLGIEGIGYNKVSFVWNSSLLAENPLLGNCHNSGYCVVGTVKK